MKKILLLAMTVVFSLSANSQTQNNLAGIKGKPASVKMKPMKVQLAGVVRAETSGRSNMPSIAQSTKSEMHNISSTLTEATIGRTIYDLQSFKSVGKRISNNGDGTISVVWNFTTIGGINGIDRGVGYNYYNGSSWLPIPNLPISSLKTGFCNIDVTPSGEYVVADGDSGLELSQRAVKGTGPWSKDTVGNWALFPIQQDLWPRFAAGGGAGNTLHVITNSQGMDTVPVLGQTGPLTYSRSTDGGITWVDDHIQIPGTDSTFMYGVGAEDYHIDVRGDVVAIVTGGFTNDVSLFKSVDGGVTWAKTVVMPFPLGQPYDPITMNTDTTGDGIGEMIGSNAGDVTVTIDNNNICHVSFSHMIISEDAGATNTSYFPTDNTGLFYWHEGMSAAIIIAAAEDFNGNGFVDIATNPADTTDPGFGLYNVGLCAQPSIGIDSSNNIYIAYSAIDERADTTAWQESFRHIFLIASPDFGLTWSTPFTLNPSPDGDFQEAVWPCVATLVDNNVHIVYQRDPAPGHSLTSNATQYNNNLLSPSDIVYAGITAIPASNSIFGDCFVDLNQNGVRDTNESGFDYVTVVSTGSYVQASQPSNGYFLNSAGIGTTITTLQILPSYSSSPLQHTSNFTTYHNIDTISFALFPLPGIQDLTLSLLPLGVARPGFNVTYRIAYANLGTVTMSGNIYLIHDNRESYLSSTDSVTNVSGDTLEFTYSNLTPLEGRYIDVNFQIDAPPLVNFGNVLSLNAYITPLITDTNPENNGITIHQTVQGSYDPNDKSMLGGSYITPTQVTDGNYLHYLIRFQNTGTDTAFTVIVKDTLSSNLDLSSLEIESASHPHTLTVSDGNKMKCQFNNINLPDSNVNEPASHGYLAYKIKPKNTLMLGNTILNTAYIYFDFNLPVVTNTTYTVVGIVSIKENEKATINASIYPNPNNGTFNIDLGKIYHDVDIKVCNVFGQVISHKQLHSTSNIIEKIHGAKGLYFVHVITENGNVVLRVVKN